VSINVIKRYLYVITVIIALLFISLGAGIFSRATSAYLYNHEITTSLYDFDNEYGNCWKTPADYELMQEFSSYETSDYVIEFSGGMIGIISGLIILVYGLNCARKVKHDILYKSNNITEEGSEHKNDPGV
jgi:hypothetical protein